MKQTHIVVLGTGFAGTYALKRLHKKLKGKKDIKITVVNDTNYFLFTPLLHEVATGAIKPSNIIEPIRKVFPCKQVSLHTGVVSSIDTEQQTVKVNDQSISYDYLIVALGSTTNFFSTPGAEAHSFPLKSLDDAITLKQHFISLMDSAAVAPTTEEQKRLLSIVLVGGGPTGVELAAETADLFYHTFARYYEQSLIHNVSITLVQRGNDILPTYDPVIRKKALNTLQKKHVTVLLNTSVDSVSASGVTLSNGKHIDTHTAIWLAGIKASDVSINNVAKNTRGSLIVLPTLQLPEAANIFVAGDLAYCEDPVSKQPLPALAQVAVAEGELAADNIIRIIQNENPKRIDLKIKGLLVSLGEWQAAGQVGKYHLSGRFAWWLWRTIYLVKLISWRKRFQVAIDWTVDLFSPRDISIH